MDQQPTMSKQRTVATVQAVTGRPFRIDRKCNLFLLKRPLTSGRHQTTVMTRADVVAVCDALIDAVESGETH